MRIYLFKVKDYTTILVGQKETEELKICKNEENRVMEYYYVQRGDGIKIRYDKDQIEWVQFLGDF